MVEEHVILSPTHGASLSHNVNVFLGDYGFPKAAVTADGAPIAVFKGTQKNLFKRIKEQIYNPSVNYKKPVSQAHWLNSQHA